MSKLRTTALMGLGAALALVGARGCGGVSNPTDPRIAARDQAAKATCDKYMACGAIGMNLTYNDYDSCLTIWQGNWEMNWPAATCEGKISQPDLTTCVDAIGGTDCTSLLDIINTLYVKCAPARVCSAGGPIADAATD
jgi:hypothetical protein